MAGGMHGWGACMTSGGMHGGLCAWQGVCMVGRCMAGGPCVAGVVGGMHGRGYAWWGHAWQGGRVWQIIRDTVNERAVRILLECILVANIFVTEFSETFRENSNVMEMCPERTPMFVTQ